jgi:hypothetical protein
VIVALFGVSAVIYQASSMVMKSHVAGPSLLNLNPAFRVFWCLRGSPVARETSVGAYACAVNCGRVYGVTYGYCDFPTVPIDNKPEPYGNRVIKECSTCGSMMYIRAYDGKAETWICEGEGKHEQIVQSLGFDTVPLQRG